MLERGLVGAAQELPYGLGAIARNPVKSAVGGIAGAAAYHGSHAYQGHRDQALGQIEAMKHDPSLIVPKFAEELNSNIKSQLEAFSNFSEKRAAEAPKPYAFKGMTGGLINTFGSSITGAIASSLVKRPMDKFFGILEKKLYTQPKQRNVLMQAIQSDPILAQEMQTNPTVLEESYKTIKKFAPSLTEDVATLRQFLRQAVTTGGVIDPMTIKLLAETEVHIKRSRGQIGGIG
jgi:hypothetical protein